MPLSQPRDPEATRRQLAPWLARRMPQARDLAITNLAPPAATGFSNDTLLFDLEWTEDGRARRAGMVVRIEPRGFTVFPAYDVGQQFHIMQRLGEATDVPVPPMFWLEDRTDVLGAPFFVMGRVEGRVPPDNPPYHAAGWMTGIAPAARAAGAIPVIHPAAWYGGLSGGTRPSTLPITKKGAPSTSVRSSSQNMGGTGTSVASPSRCMMWNCWPTSYAGKTVKPRGSKRTTIPARRARPSSVHSRSKRSVSFEKPVAAGGAMLVIARSRACGIRRASQGASCRRVASGSRGWESGIGRSSSPAEGRTRARELSRRRSCYAPDAGPVHRRPTEVRYGRRNCVALRLGVSTAAT